MKATTYVFFLILYSLVLTITGYDGVITQFERLENLHFDFEIDDHRFDGIREKLSRWEQIRRRILQTWSRANESGMAAQPVPINISVNVPEDYAIPLYGYVTPLIVAITIITHTFIVIVLTRPHLRTPTNFILLSMAIAELLNVVFTAPWLMYYYTFGGYITDRVSGIPQFWCNVYLMLYNYIPNVFHNAIVWLTVYLALQRYIYVCTPRMVSHYCTPTHTKIAVLVVCLLAFLAEFPFMLGRYTLYDPRLAPRWARSYTCYVVLADWVHNVLTPAFFYHASFWGKALFVHGIPCILLILFTGALVRTIREAELRKRSLQPNINGRRNNSVASIAGRSMRATNKMLIAVILLFLAMEIPAAVIFMVHTLAVTYDFLPEQYYHWINVSLIFRNVLLMLTFPLNFFIYCGMSEQFRLTVKQMFTRSVLFVPQQTPALHDGRKRYSFLLVNPNRESLFSQKTSAITLHETPLKNANDEEYISSAQPFIYGNRKRQKVEFTGRLNSTEEAERKGSDFLSPTDCYHQTDVV